MRYETPEDKSNEWSDCAEFILHANERTGRTRNLIEIPLEPNRATPDYWIHDEDSGQYVSVLEHKRRKYTLPKLMEFGGPYIGKDKYDALMYWVREGYAAVLLVRFLDGLRFLALNKPHQIREGVDGRTDRKDPNDRKPVVYFTDPSNWINVPAGVFNNG